MHWSYFLLQVLHGLKVSVSSSARIKPTNLRFQLVIVLSRVFSSIYLHEWPKTGIILSIISRQSFLIICSSHRVIRSIGSAASHRLFLFLVDYVNRWKKGTEKWHYYPSWQIFDDNFKINSFFPLFSILHILLICSLNFDAVSKSTLKLIHYVKSRWNSLPVEWETNSRTFSASPKKDHQGWHKNDLYSSRNKWSLENCIFYSMHIVCNKLIYRRDEYCIKIFSSVCLYRGPIREWQHVEENYKIKDPSWTKKSIKNWDCEPALKIYLGTCNK